MAAGLSIEEKNIEEFRRRLNVNCTLTDEELRPKIVIDVPMPVSYITKELVEQISLLEPFGKGNTKPVFAQKNLRVLDYSIIGKNKNVVKLKLLDPQGISGMSVLDVAPGDFSGRHLFRRSRGFCELYQGKRQYFCYLLSGDQQIQGTRESSDYYSELLLILPPVL